MDSRWRDSNPQPRLYESRALPLSYIGDDPTLVGPTPLFVKSYDPGPIIPNRETPAINLIRERYESM